MIPIEKLGILLSPTDLDFENNSDDFNYIITEMNRTLGYR